MSFQRQTLPPLLGHVVTAAVAVAVLVEKLVELTVAVAVVKDCAVRLVTRVDAILVSKTKTKKKNSPWS